MIHQHHRITVALTVALAFAATAAPVASADPPPLATAEAATAANIVESTSVVPNPDEQTLMLDRASSPPLRTATVIRPNPDQQPPAVARFSSDDTPSTPGTIVRVVAPNGGLDWGDAGIGAAVGFALSMFAVGSVIVISRRRTGRGEAAQAS